MAKNRLIFLDAVSGVGIIFVIMSHLQFPSSIWVEDFFRKIVPLNLGNLGVLLFFMRSGYGLYISRKSSWPDFYKKRLLKIIPALAIATITITAASLLIFDKVIFLKSGMMTPKILIANSLGVQHLFNIESINGSLWFISVIWVFYLLFPLLFSISYKHRAALLLFIVAALYGISKIDILSYLPNFYYYIIIFIAGLFFAKYGENFAKMKHFKVFAFGVLAYALAYFYFLIRYRNFFDFYEQFSPLTALFKAMDIILAALLFYVFYMASYGNLSSNLSSFLSKYSFYLFIINLPLFYLLTQVKNVFVYFLLFLIVCAISCIFLRFIDNLIESIGNKIGKEQP